MEKRIKRIRVSKVIPKSTYHRLKDGRKVRYWNKKARWKVYITYEDDSLETRYLSFWQYLMWKLFGRLPKF